MRSLSFLPLVAGAAAYNNASNSYPYRHQELQDNAADFPFGQVGSEQLGISSLAGFSNPSKGVSRGGGAQCISGDIMVSASTMSNVRLNFDYPQNQSQVTNTFIKFVTAGSPFMDNLVAGTQNVSGTYKIGATLCVPKNGSTSKGVQLLTHGVGFDRYYWDFAPGYSYVDAAAAHGWSTFFYDRLGIGASEKADPLNVVQAPLEVEIAQSIASRLRNGSFASTSFSTVVGVGHSYGSIITQGVTNKYPTSLNAAILTGFTTNTAGIQVFLIGNDFQLANQNQPYRFNDLNNGYLVADGITNNEIAFFRSPGFDPRILSLADSTKGTVTFGELFSQTAATKPAGNFTGPVAVVNGAEDLPFCDGNCTLGDKAQAVRPALYPNTPEGKFGTYLAPTSGHGLNLHYSAQGAYEYIQMFLGSQGVGV